MMEKTVVSRGAWSLPEWRAVGVVAMEAGPDSAGQPAGEPIAVRAEPTPDDAGVMRLLWTGYRLNLYKDAAESYWINLLSDDPALFVICHETPDGTMQPLRITADGLAASGSIEGDDQVYRVAIPPEVYLQIERFVVENHEAQPRRKRKRENWKESTG